MQGMHFPLMLSLHRRKLIWRSTTLQTRIWYVQSEPPSLSMQRRVCMCDHIIVTFNPDVLSVAAPEYFVDAGWRQKV